MLVANDDEGWWCAKESEQLNVMTDIAKLSRGVERAAWGREPSCASDTHLEYLIVI
jgi:hypothetical protein